MECEIPSECLEPVWRNLCAGMLLHATIKAEAHAKLNGDMKKDDYLQCQAAVRWIDGCESVVTYSDACAACNVEEEAMRALIQQRAKERKRKPQTDLRSCFKTKCLAVSSSN